MNVSLEVLKNEQNKYIFCRIEVEARPVLYFAEQKRPHRTHRWMNTEQWAAYDAKLQELLSRNELDNLNHSRIFKLNNSFYIQLTNSAVSKDTLYKTLNSNEIKREDIINAIDCKIVHQDDAAINRLVASHPIKLEVASQQEDLAASSDFVPSVGEELTISSCDDIKENSSQEDPTTSKNVNIFNDDPDVAINSSQENSYLTPSKQTHTEESIRLQLRSSERKHPEAVKFVSPVSFENSSQDIPLMETNINPTQSCDNKKKGTSSDSDFVEKSLSRRLKFDENPIDDKPEQPIELKSASSDISLKKYISNDNEKTDSEVEASPVLSEQRKRKLYHSSEEILVERKDKDSIRPKRKQLKTSEHSKDNEIECASAKKESSHSRSSSKSTKKKKSYRERSKSPCDREKRSMTKWLSKKSSKSDEKTPHKSDKSSSSSSHKHASSSRKHHSDRSEQSSSHKQHTKPSTTSKPVEKTLSNEEQLERLRQDSLIVEKDRKLIKSIKELLPKKPQKVRMLNLLKMSADEMLATYEEHCIDLENIFQAQKSQKKYSCIDGVNHFFVIDLVTDKVQQKLMDKLGDFEKVVNTTPKYGDLFSMVLMPEWILRVFMAKFKMSRSEAIVHIKAQNEYNACNSISNADLDKMVLKK